MILGEQFDKLHKINQDFLIGDKIRQKITLVKDESRKILTS